MENRIRVLKLVNNFYRDNLLPDDFKREEKLGEFCVLGYYDAIDIETSNNKEKIWTILSKLSVNCTPQKGCYRMLVCLTDELKKDEIFWKDKNSMPFYFISMIRVDRTKVDATNLYQKVKDYTIYDHQMIYMSYGHSEVIVITKTQTYETGMKSVKNLREKFVAFKIYTIFAMCEDAIAKNEEKDEIVNFRLRCIIKNYIYAQKFKEQLYEEVEKIQKDAEVKCYDTLGGNDWLIEINNIFIKKFLKLYLMGKFMTHTSELYEKGLFNIESEILILEKGD